ncbi:STAS domain-containing protein [Novosphingobium album (ex Liu et al. 2023)]|uniref:STAS domain-containing protein n=1 Tax=Novosphingobium album (ex Liu et al. 2023) TaxID=3031130 RepID=A0ABT5WX03_9SPHN|nr:STAS domain-containing protein [Novosphingobium album (ex Liu et al. 2023)]MDE8654430.1 STAS domain-containing protein [Novosphingobium album (ex Liu et al. 2023)]
MTSISLPARCDRAAAEALWPELVAAMGSGATAIDGSAVAQIGQAMLQLLVSARRSGNGATIIASAALREAAQLTGLEAELFDEGDL